MVIDVEPWKEGKVGLLKSQAKEIGETLKRFILWHERNSMGISGLPSKNVKSEDLDSVRFEVMLLGKLQLKDDLPTQLTFIDEAVKKYHSLELEHAAEKEELKLVQNPAKDITELSVANSSATSKNSYSALIDGSRGGAEEILRYRNQNRRPSYDDARQQRCNSFGNTNVMRRQSNRVRHCSEPSTAASMGFDKNKTRIFQVGKQSVTLISPDQSARNVVISFDTIARCSKGVKYTDHFGLFVNDSGQLGVHHNFKRKDDHFKFKCYLFKCSEGYVCDEIMQAIRQACSVCAHGPEPMRAFHSLCKHINIASGDGSERHRVDKGTSLTNKCIAEAFTEAEQKKIKLKIDEMYKKNPPKSKYEQLVIVLDMIRGIYEERQLEHDAKLKHLRDPQSQSAVGKRLNFFKTRAKKSLTSIESFWGKGLQKMQELQHENHIQSPVERFRFFGDNARSAPNTPAAHQSAPGSHPSRTRHHSESPTIASGGPCDVDSSRPRSNTLGSPSQGSINVRRRLTLVDQQSVDSLELAEMRSSCESLSHFPRSFTPQNTTPEKSFVKKLSARQKIFNTIATPRSEKKATASNMGFSSPMLSNGRLPSPLKTPEQIRLAWRRAIQDQIMLNKIEKLSTISTDGFAVTNPLSDKLHYDDVQSCLSEMFSLWEELLTTNRREQYKMDEAMLHVAVKKGVPSILRGKVWTLLYEQWKLRYHKNNQSTNDPSMASYETLIKQLTPHQHAILIDIGRTFPSHPYFSQQLSDGQLALFNLLKVYSLVDSDVGYCQGLSFVAGVLLLHISTGQDAFSLLSHLMNGMDCRKLYLPDMDALRVAVYQLSRLIYDFHSDLHSHFEENDVSLMLFATPWFLTMFASVLPLGFTARVFDLLFLEGIPALFKTALCLFSFHKHNLLKEVGFENIISYLKNSLLKMEKQEMVHVIDEMFDIDIGDRLLVYEAEYNVLEDEGGSAADAASEDMEKKYCRLQQSHQTVTKYNLDLVEQLEAARMQISSLQQGLSEMAAIDEKRTLELEQLRHENQRLKAGRY